MFKPRERNSTHGGGDRPGFSHEIRRGDLLTRSFSPISCRQFAANGAEFMVTITNDAWFGPSSAPYQHFGMVVFRAVENRVAFARAANTGISGVHRSYGRIPDAMFTQRP